jgi:hypothetical protein
MLFIYLLTADGEAVGAYTEEHTAELDMHLCKQGDMYTGESGRQYDIRAMPITKEV